MNKMGNIQNWMKTTMKEKQTNQTKHNGLRYVNGLRKFIHVMISHLNTHLNQAAIRRVLLVNAYPEWRMHFKIGWNIMWLPTIKTEVQNWILGYSLQFIDKQSSYLFVCSAVSCAFSLSHFFYPLDLIHCANRLLTDQRLIKKNAHMIVVPFKLD